MFVKRRNHLVVVFTLNGSRAGPSREVTTRNPDFMYTGNDSRVRSCACGDPYCNIITTFLGTRIVSSKCCYALPSKSQKPKKRFQSQAIVKKLKHFRINTSERFRLLRQMILKPTKYVRFNEIHYPILFLNKFMGNRRIPESIDIDLAKEVNMFHDDMVWLNSHMKPCVIVAPTLDAHQAIQVNILYKSALIVISSVLIIMYNGHTGSCFGFHRYFSLHEV